MSIGQKNLALNSVSMYVYYVRSNLLTLEITLRGLQLKQQQVQHAAVQGQGLASVHPQLSVVVEEKSDELSAPASANSSCDSRKNRSGCYSSNFILLAFSKSLLKLMAITPYKKRKVQRSHDNRYPLSRLSALRVL